MVCRCIESGRLLGGFWADTATSASYSTANQSGPSIASEATIAQCPYQRQILLVPVLFTAPVRCEPMIGAYRHIQPHGG